MQPTAIIADDLTGAGDSAVHYARAGVNTALVLDPLGLPHCLAPGNAVALSTESRFINPQAAAEAARLAAMRCREAGAGFFYKKVDSALRGNIGAETTAVMRALGIATALVCSALPEAGRVCINGTLLFDGRPIHTTDLGQDPFTPVTTSDVAQCFAATCPPANQQAGLQTGQPGLVDTGLHIGLQIGHLGLAEVAAGGKTLRRAALELVRKGCHILIADAVETAHLDALAELVRSSGCSSPTCSVDATGKGIPPTLASGSTGDELPTMLPVGSAGLAKALAGPARPTGARPSGRLLAIVGSLNSAAWEQADYACARKAYFPLILDVQAGLANPEAECERLVRKALIALSAGPGNILLRGSAIAPSEGICPDSGARVAKLFGMAAQRLCQTLPFASVFATGGNTAVAVAGALGIISVVLHDELMPGVVLGSCEGANFGVRWFISKAGSFGGKDALAAVAAAVRPGG